MPAQIIYVCILISVRMVFGNLFNVQQKSNVFVDKSELLAVFFDNSTPAYNLVTCPFKFGKTLNSDMIALFANVELDKTHKPKSQNITYAYSIFSTLKISRYSDVLRDHLARHPVVHLSVAENLQASPKTALGAELRKAWQKYRWLTKLPSDRLGSVDAEDIDYLKKLLSDDPAKLRITEAILRICRTLYTYFDQSTVILLIDNYDNTSCQAFVNEAEPRYTLEYYKYLNKMISRALLNGGQYISRALISSLTSLPLSLPSCDLSMIRHHVFLDNHPFARHYGYLRHEADELMVNLSMPESMRSKVLSYYRGYRIVGTDTHLYNPNTIYQYHLHRQKLRLEYIRRDSLKVLTDPIKEFNLFNSFFKMCRFREHILLLSITDRLHLPYDITSYQTGAFEEAITLKLRKYYDTSDQYTRTLLTLFFELGYFKKAIDHGGHNHSNRVYVWANVEPKISTVYEVVFRFEQYSQYVPVGSIIFDMISDQPEANLTNHLEYLRSNASRMYNSISRTNELQVSQLQFKAMIYHSISRKVNTYDVQNVRIIDEVSPSNLTSCSRLDMYVNSPDDKIIGVIVVRFEVPIQEALNEALNITFPSNRTANHVKYVVINVVEDKQPLQVDAIARTVYVS